jgi:hypothetical protein
MTGNSPQNNPSHENVILCQVCQYFNPPEAEVCGLCGCSLDTPTTVIVPEKELDDTWTNQLPSIIRMYPDALVLYVMGGDQPIVFRGSGMIVLGRQAVGAPHLTLDLTLYNGHRLGVSRRHARISPTEDGYTIEDMSSANGTFVNETKLPIYEPHPLRNGDIVRLGQLMFFVYFLPKHE